MAISGSCKPTTFGETSYILVNSAQGENPRLASIRGVDSLAMDPRGLSHGGIHPAEQWFWWSSATASPVDPSYGPVTPIIGGRHRLAQVWCLEGDCQG